MKKILLFILILFTHISVHAQSGMWTWMKGDSINGTNGVFGTLGVGDPLNTPPSVYEPCEWLDHMGRLWLMGGGYYNNCFWMYDPSANEWTWMGGSSGPSQVGAYGTQGIPSVNNHPGARLAATSWTDTDGNLWLYGGYGYASINTIGGLNDLWKYDISSGEWTWIHGSNFTDASTVFGTMGVPDPGNTPGGRLECAASWADNSGNLWLFGGQLCCNAYGYIDDVWRYDIANDEWTWMQGSNVTNQAGVYGTQGIPDPANRPGGRRIYSHWKDEQGNFWIFGGQDYVSNCFNDLWKYDPSANEWAWMNGSSSPNAAGDFGTQCSFDSLNQPPARMENRFCWTDSCFNFWMFGGLNTISGVSRNDLWCYAPSLNQWKWVSGSNGNGEDGQYGTNGVAGAGNHPGARYGGVGWLGANESLWLFGGVGEDGNSNYGSLNDLWLFQPDSACVSCVQVNVPVSNFFVSNADVCEKFCVNFFDNTSNNPTSWQWSFPGASPISSSDQYPTNICYNAPGTYDVTLITTNSYGSDTLTLSNYITVYATPSIPTITQNGYVLTSSPADSYQWQLNATDIGGATDQSYEVLQTGFYTVIVSDSNGCKNSATLYVEITGIHELNDMNISVYPNPSNGNFIVEFMNSPNEEEVSVDVVNAIGQEVYSSREKILSSNWKKEFNLSTLTDGIYYLSITAKDCSFNKMIVLTQ